MTLQTRSKLADLAIRTVAKKRLRITKHLVPLADELLHNIHATRVKYDTKQGYVSFMYAGRRLMYYVGTMKLMVYTQSGYTLYNNVPPILGDILKRLGDE